MSPSLNLEQLESRECLSPSTDWWTNHLCQRAPAAGAGGYIGETVLTRGWATFGQVVPEGTAYAGVQVGDLPTQTDVKTRWPDGSIRFAVVTAKVPTAGAYTLAAGPALAGDVVAAPSYASVGFQDAGGGVWATGQWMATSADRWLDGPLVIEERHTTPVFAYPSLESVHPWLTATFDVRIYRDGSKRIDLTVENTNDVAGGYVGYDVVAWDNDTPWFAAANVTHPYLTRWRKTYEVGTFSRVEWAALEPAYVAGALPRYWEGVSDDVQYVWGSDFDILGRGSLEPDMPAHGGRPEIAPYPDWAARYLVHQNPDQRAFVLAHGDLAGSWPVHVREPDGSFVTIDQRPNYWLDPLGRFEDGPSGWPLTGPLTPDNAHQPSLAYIPYLLTGDRYYAEEMSFWANYVLLSTFQESFYQGRGGSQGLLVPNQTRGFAWGLRNLVDAAAYLPDDDPLKPYFTEKVVNNLRWLDGQARDAIGPLGVGWHQLYDNPAFDPGEVHFWTSLFMHNYLAWAIGHAHAQGFAGGGVMRDQVIRFQTSFIANPATRDGAAPYYLAIGERRTGRYFSSAEESYSVTGPTEYSGYFGVDARLSLLGAQAAGISTVGPDGVDALEWLMNQPDMVRDLSERGGWATV